MIKLSLEQKEQLQEIMSNKQWDAVLQLCNMAVERAERGVCSSDVLKPENVMAERQKLEGAKLVRKIFQNISSEIKNG